MQTIMPLLIAAQIFVSPKCLLRFTMSMPSLGLGGQVYGLVSALFPFILFVLFFLFSQLVFGFGAQKQSAELGRGQIQV